MCLAKTSCDTDKGQTHELSERKDSTRRHGHAGSIQVKFPGWWTQQVRPCLAQTRGKNPGDPHPAAASESVHSHWLTATPEIRSWWMTYLYEILNLGPGGRVLHNGCAILRHNHNGWGAVDVQCCLPCGYVSGGILDLCDSHTGVADTKGCKLQRGRGDSPCGTPLTETQHMHSVGSVRQKGVHLLLMRQIGYWGQREDTIGEKLGKVTLEVTYIEPRQLWASAWIRATHTLRRAERGASSVVIPRKRTKQRKERHIGGKATNAGSPPRKVGPCAAAPVSVNSAQSCAVVP
eukprot:scaffold4470_cov255-Prasinococcus_capsulatus_cf.AAC.2